MDETPPPLPPGQPPPLPPTWSASSSSSLTPQRPTAPPQPPSRLKKFLAPLGVIGVLLLKFKGLLAPLLKFGKFIPVMLKTGGTMLLSIWLYATQWGWKFAVGFVLLIFVHECGHIIAARHFGLSVSAPMFIPFVGALISMRELPRNAWVESWIGISGPLLGTLGSAACFGAFLATGQLLWAGLAFSGFFLNLFNLAPVGFLDGGRIVTAISPWLWIVGAGCLATMLLIHFNLLVLIILIMSVPRVVSLFRKKSPEEKRYFELAAWQRVTMTALYFGLIAVLLYGMRISHVDPRAGHAPAAVAEDPR